MRTVLFLTLACLVICAGTADARDGEQTPCLRPVPLTAVTADGPFWGPRLDIVRRSTLPHVLKQCEDTGRIRNFSKAAGLMPGKHEGYFFNDSDVYKAVEGAAYFIALRRDPALEKQLDDLIAAIAAAQQPDGYLNTYYILTDPAKRWTNTKEMHELYCAGHLIEAGIAYHQATGKRSLLDVAIKLADHIDAVFGPKAKHATSGHPEIELALLKLHHATGEDRYLRLARFFLDQRGRAEGRELYGEYCQDHQPLPEQREAVGHAVRAMYLYSSMADNACITRDQGYFDAMHRIWADLLGRKMYVTGGIGSLASNEGFSSPYNLPNDTAYAETCAAIGLVFWSHRLNLLHADARYVDVLERVLYNGLLSGISLDGDKFFYTNPLASWCSQSRQPFYPCACCPPNLARFFPTLGGYVYAQSDDALFVNLYAAGTATLTLSATPLTIRQQTEYPWKENVTINVEPERPAEFAICLRIPDWCSKPTIKLSGEAVADLKIVDGYARLQRPWQKGDTLELTLPMPVRRIEAHPRVAADAGRVALQRGPVVYCLEAADNGGRVRNLSLPRSSQLTARHVPDLLGGVTVIQGVALARENAEPPAGPVSRPVKGPTSSPAASAALASVNEEPPAPLYREALTKEVPFTAIPYYAWANREPGEMIVWIPESPTLTDPSPLVGVKPSASHCFASDSVRALCDRIEPASSSDQDIPRFTWWDRRGSSEWVQYDFASPRRLQAVEVYWFDDTSAGGRCKAPVSWRLFYRDGEAWRPVKNAAPYGTKLSRFNRVQFEAVQTDALRIVADLADGCSGGILEWRLDGD
jgi:DUF1680 family protein